MSEKNICGAWKKPPVPDGYKYVKGSWDSGLMIERCSDQSAFVWIPAMILPEDGSLDGEKYNLSFGSRKRFKSSLSFPEPARTSNSDLLRQYESVKKYGGFYLSAYSASSTENGTIHSHKGVMPITNINLRDAAIMAAGFETGEELSSHLPYEAEIDSALCWLMQCGLIQREEICFDNALRDTRGRSAEICRTGEKSPAMNGICDLLGNIDEWTQESFDGAFVRGCGGKCTYPQSIRCYYVPYPCYYYSGFRLALYIK